MEPCTTYQNTHHQLTVVIGSQRGKTCWPFMFKLMSNIKWYHSYYILQSGKTPLHDASQRSNEQVVKTLIKAGADVNTTDEVSYIKHQCVISYEIANNGTYMQ